MNAERCKEIMAKIAPMETYQDAAINALELYELCEDAMKFYRVEAALNRRDGDNER